MKELDNIKKFKILYFDSKKEMISIIEQSLATRNFDIKVVNSIEEFKRSFQLFFPNIVFLSLTIDTAKEGAELYFKLKKDIEEKSENISLCVLCDNLIDVDTNSIEIENALVRPINPIKILRKITEDIKKIKNTQQLNEKLNENFLFNLIIKAMPDIIMRIDELEFIRYCNFPNRYKAFFNDIDIVNKHLEESVSRETYREMRDNINLARQHKIIKIMHYEESNIKNEIRIIPLEDESVVMVIRDITEQKILKSVLEKFEESYTALVQTEDHVMFRITSDLIITMGNENFKNMVNKQIVSGYHLKDVLDYKHYDEIVKYLKKLNFNNRTTLFEQKITLNEEERVFQFIVRSIYSGEDYESRMLDEYQIFGRDITKMLSVGIDVKEEMEPNKNKVEKRNSKLQSVSNTADEISDEFEQLIKRINRHNLGGG